MNSMFAFMCVRHVTVRDSGYAGCTGLSCHDWTVIVVSLYSVFTFRWLYVCTYVSFWLF